MQSDKPSDNQPSVTQPTWTFNASDQSEVADNSVQALDDNPSTTDSVSWTASEFIAHTKSFMWYVVLLLITAGVLAVVYFVSGDKFVMGVIVIISLLFGYTGSRKPRELPYAIDSDGLHIDQKSYPFDRFKSFSLVDEGGVEAIWLMPLQRFAPGLSIYFDPADRSRIVDILGDYLPIEERKPDLVDTLMHKIRF